MIARIIAELQRQLDWALADFRQCDKGTAGRTYMDGMSDGLAVALAVVAGSDIHQELRDADRRLDAAKNNTPSERKSV